MKFKTGDKIITKKPHACGKSEWIIERTGADIKLRCLCCGRAVFLLPDQLEKRVKTYIDGDENEK